MDTETQTSKFNLKKLIVGLVLVLAAILIIFLIYRFTFNNKEVGLTPTVKTLQLNLTSPKENFATSEKSLTIAGNTAVKGVVTISSGKQAKIVETSGNSFSTNLDLVEGKNTITIVAFDPATGESQTTTKQILYLNEDLTNL